MLMFRYVMFQLQSISSAHSASTVKTVNFEIGLLAHYSMPSENRIMRESYPSKGIMSLYISGILSPVKPISPIICIIDDCVY